MRVTLGVGTEDLFQRNELRVERAEVGKVEKERKQSMAKDRERMAEAGELEKEKRRMHH